MYNSREIVVFVCVALLLVWFKIEQDDRHEKNNPCILIT